MAIVTCRAVDGGIAEIHTSEYPAEVYTTDAVARLDRLGGRRHRIAAGHLKFAEGTAYDVDVSIGMIFTEEYEFQGGRLRLGAGRATVGPDGVEYYETGPDGRPRLKLFRIAVWEGSSHSFYSHRYGGESSELVTALNEFRISDADEGLTCIPRSPATTFVRGPAVMRMFPSIGLFEVEALTSQSEKGIPRHEGTKVRGGQLYVDRRGSSPVHFLLVGETAITRIFPEDPHPDSDTVEKIEDLLVHWEHGSP